MNVDVEVTELIARPVADVAAYATEPTNAPRWYQRITAADRETDGPVQVGSRFAFKARFMGRDLAYTYEVTGHEPGVRLTMSTADGPFPMTTDYRWEPSGTDTTTMSIRNHGQPTGFSRLASPLLSIAMRRAMRGDLRTLKKILER